MSIKVEKSIYYKIETPDGKLHVHINYDPETKKMKSIFLRLPPLGTTISSLTAIIGTLITKYIEAGGDIENLLKHLYSVKSSKRIILDSENDQNITIESTPQAIAYCIKNFLEKSKKNEL